MRAALAATSGLALAAAFPKLDLNLLAWVAFVPLLYAVEGERPWVALQYGWMQGFACYIASLYWVVITLHSFAGVRTALALLPLILLGLQPSQLALFGAGQPPNLCSLL